MASSAPASARSIEALMGEGIAHQEAQRFAAAVECFSRVVAVAPEHGPAWRRLGIAALRRGDYGAAHACIERALAIADDDPAAHRLQGTIHEFEGNLRPAYRAYARAYQLDPGLEQAAIGLARTALALGHASEAVTVAQAAVARGVVDAGLLRTLGAARTVVRDYAGAADALRAALQLEPHPDAFANLAAVELQFDHPDEALGACERALALDPDHAVATLHAGIARLVGGQIAPALAAFERAVSLGCEAAHINLGRLRVSLGEYHAAWPHFGWDDDQRRKLPPFGALPMWDGRPAPDARLLVWHEQGVGDTMLFARFLRLARERVASLTLACPPETVDLFASVAGVDTTADIRRLAGLGAYDAWLPTTRLPVIFDVSPQTLPFAPYVSVDPARRERFRTRLAGPAALRVGLVWSGNENFARNRARSCELAELEELAAVPGVRWFALQQGSARADVPSNAMRLDPINREISDYADTAAIIEQLDLVLTVDTSVANLAGALGARAWVLLSKLPDWRWHLAGDRTPWYPSLRLFRQQTAGAWRPVIAQVATELHRLVSNG